MLKSVFKVFLATKLELRLVLWDYVLFLGCWLSPHMDVLRLYSHPSYLLLFTLGKVLCRQHLKIHFLD